MKRILTTLGLKWPEYLLEILVITIGILGAFALNNWGEKIKDHQKEQQLLKQILSDYEANLIQLDQKIEMRRSIIQASRNILNAFDQPQDASKDSLVAQLACLLDDPTFDPINSKLISSGNLQYIQNPRLNKLLSSWTSDIVAVQEIEQSWSRMVIEDYAQILRSFGVSRDAINLFWTEIDHEWLLDKEDAKKLSIGKSSNMASMEEMLSSRELESIISYAIGMNYSTNQQSLGLRKRILEIINLAKDEIE